MWYDFRDVQNDAQQAYQDDLWKKAYALQRGPMIRTAYRRKLIKEVAASFRRADEELYRDWMKAQGQKP
jgi:hypothetical protein